MAKDKLTDYDATASNNTDIGGIDINQGTMIPSNVDNAIREIMSHLKDFAAGTQAVDAVAINNTLGVGTTSPETPVEIRTTNKLGGTFTGTVDGEGLRVTQTDYTAGNYVSLVEAPYDDSQTAANVRIAGMFDGGGSNLAFGTSNSYGSGITNTAMFIHSSGNVQLSGGLSFAGNDVETAANALDDYEEGDWTPAYVPGGGTLSVTYDIQIGKYVKVGGLVHASFILRSDAASGGAGSLFVGGLPFAGAVRTNAFYSGSVGYSANFTTVNPQAIHIGSNGTTIVLLGNITSGDANSDLRLAVSTANLSNSTNSNFIVAQMIYPTDA